MNESDDEEGEDGRSEQSAMSEEDWTDDASSVQTNSAPTTPTRQKRKRMRSLTPGSADGVNGSGTRDALGSPLAKRKKVAAERTGYSKLKEAITADELHSGGAPQVDGVGDGEAQVVRRMMTAKERTGEDDEEDFLARELEEEWG
ncbi:hypothetical protein MVEN_02081900 [Mycena venus]|uniref:Uncharacterized protein n=1 Tax=Mycena venus TaxID=2733690 RepID=A0A8H6XDH5_9AGAR|nr:hypothetical protein MVEN_02081900 [Mycena venus]